MEDAISMLSSFQLDPGCMVCLILLLFSEVCGRFNAKPCPLQSFLIDGVHGFGLILPNYNRTVQFCYNFSVSVIQDYIPNAVLAIRGSVTDPVTSADMTWREEPKAKHGPTCHHRVLQTMHTSTVEGQWTVRSLGGPEVTWWMVESQRIQRSPK